MLDECRTQRKWHFFVKFYTCCVAILILAMVLPANYQGVRRWNPLYGLFT